MKTHLAMYQLHHLIINLLKHFGTPTIKYNYNRFMNKKDQFNSTHQKNKSTHFQVLKSHNCFQYVRLLKQHRLQFVHSNQLLIKVQIDYMIVIKYNHCGSGLIMILLVKIVLMVEVNISIPDIWRVKDHNKVNRTLLSNQEFYNLKEKT